MEYPTKEFLNKIIIDSKNAQNYYRTLIERQEGAINLATFMIEKGIFVEEDKKNE